jgi:hypothetical protein
LALCYCPGGSQAAYLQAGIGVSYSYCYVVLIEGFCWLPCHAIELAVQISLAGDMRCCSCHAELGSSLFESFVVGDFPAQEARGFLDCCLQGAGKPAVEDADWEAVYKVGQLCVLLVCRHTHRPFSISTST